MSKDCVSFHFLAFSNVLASVARLSWRHVVVILSKMSRWLYWKSCVTFFASRMLSSLLIKCVFFPFISLVVTVLLFFPGDFQSRIVEHSISLSGIGSSRNCSPCHVGQNRRTPVDKGSLFCVAITLNISCIILNTGCGRNGYLVRSDGNFG